MCCSVLRCVAVCCSVLQQKNYHIRSRFKTVGLCIYVFPSYLYVFPLYIYEFPSEVASECIHVLQCVVVCYSVLQCVAVASEVLSDQK